MSEPTVKGAIIQTILDDPRMKTATYGWTDGYHKYLITWLDKGICYAIEVADIEAIVSSSLNYQSSGGPKFYVPEHILGRFSFSDPEFPDNLLNTIRRWADDKSSVGHSGAIGDRLEGPIISDA
jgi:hypothetical protein